MVIAPKEYGLLHHKSMQFIQGSNRNQTYFAKLEDHADIDNPVRLMDAFTDKPDLSKPGFINTAHKSEGALSRHVLLSSKLSYDNNDRMRPSSQLLFLHGVQIVSDGLIHLLYAPG